MHYYLQPPTNLKETTTHQQKGDTYTVSPLKLQVSFLTFIPTQW